MHTNIHPIFDNENPSLNAIRRIPRKDPQHRLPDPPPLPGSQSDSSISSTPPTPKSKTLPQSFSPYLDRTYNPTASRRHRKEIEETRHLDRDPFGDRTSTSKKVYSTTSTTVTPISKEAVMVEERKRNVIDEDRKKVPNPTPFPPKQKPSVFISTHIPVGPRGINNEFTIRRYGLFVTKTTDPTPRRPKLGNPWGLFTSIQRNKDDILIPATGVVTEFAPEIKKSRYGLVLYHKDIGYVNLIDPKTSTIARYVHEGGLDNSSPPVANACFSVIRDHAGQPPFISIRATIDLLPNDEIFCLFDQHVYACTSISMLGNPFSSENEVVVPPPPTLPKDDISMMSMTFTSLKLDDIIPDTEEFAEILAASRGGDFANPILGVDKNIRYPGRLTKTGALYSSIGLGHLSKVTSLIDTGADMSAINQKFLLDNFEDAEDKINYAHCGKVKLADATVSATIVGSIYLQVEINPGHRIYLFFLIIPDCTLNVIIGVQSLDVMHAIIDFPAQRIHYEFMEVAPNSQRICEGYLPFTIGDPGSHVPLFTTKDVELMGSSQQIIEVTTLKDYYSHLAGTTGLVTPRGDKEDICEDVDHAPGYFQCANTLTTWHDKNLPVPSCKVGLLRSQPSRITLPKGTFIGFYSFLEDEDEIVSSDSAGDSSMAGKPNHKQ